MDTKKVFFTITLLVFIAFKGIGQQKDKELKVGDKLPDLIISNIINRPYDSVKLKDLYKNKLLIIDFWGTYCKPCLEEMKFLDSLKGKNPDKFNVLLITTEDRNTIDKFFSRRGNVDLQQKHTLVGTDDKLLKLLFPYSTIPHNIWIDSTGTIKAITSGKAITSANILAFNSQSGQHLLETKNDNLTFDPVKEFHLGDTLFTYRSIITPFIPGINSGIYGGGNKPKRFFQFNGSITHLFWAAFSNNRQWRSDLIEVHTNDSLRLFYPAGKLKKLLKGSGYKDLGDWTLHHTYCYALTLPEAVPDTIFRNYMFSDLQRQFNVSAQIKHKNIPCTVVRRVKNNLLKPGKMDGQKDISNVPGNKLKISNVNLKELLEWWWTMNDERNQPHPFLIDIEGADHVFFDDVLDFSTEPDIDSDGYTYAMFCRLMAKRGYEFKVEIRPYPVLILTDLKN